MNFKIFKFKFCCVDIQLIEEIQRVPLNMENKYSSLIHDNYPVWCETCPVCIIIFQSFRPRLCFEKNSIFSDSIKGRCLGEIKQQKYWTVFVRNWIRSLRGGAREGVGVYLHIEYLGHISVFNRQQKVYSVQSTK